MVINTTTSIPKELTIMPPKTGSKVFKKMTPKPSPLPLIFAAISPAIFSAAAEEGSVLKISLLDASSLRFAQAIHLKQKSFNRRFLQRLLYATHLEESLNFHSLLTLEASMT